MKCHVVVAIALSSLALLGLANPARADEEPPPVADEPAASAAARDDLAARVRKPGSIVLDDLFGFFVTSSGMGGGAVGVVGGWFFVGSSTSDSANGKTESSTLAFRPSADVFVVEGLSLGAAIGIQRSTSKTTGDAAASFETTQVRRSLMPRVGYAFPIAKDVLFWPRAFVEIGSASATTDQGTSTPTPSLSTSSDGSFWAVGADAQVLFALARHVLVGIGPQLAYGHEKRDDPHAASSALALSGAGSIRVAF